MEGMDIPRAGESRLADGKAPGRALYHVTRAGTGLRRGIGHATPSKPATQLLREALRKVRILIFLALLLRLILEGGCVIRIPRRSGVFGPALIAGAL